MWDNIGLDVEKTDLTSYQASTYIFNRLGLEGGLMQSFHNKYMNSENQEDYLNKLEMLEYDTLYGNRYAYDGTNPFPQTDMKMGIREIKATGYQTNETDVTIFGVAFNEFSQVYVDGKSVDTTFLNSMKLSVSLEDFEGAKEFYVAQEGDDHVVLSITDTVPIVNDSSSRTKDLTTEEGITETTTGEE